MKEHPWARHLTSPPEKGGGVLFWVLSHLTTKDPPFVVAVTRCPWIWLEANNWTSSNKHRNHQQLWSYVLMAHNILNGINDVSIVWQLFIAGNEDNLDNSDHLSSQSVLSHTLLRCTYLVFVLFKDMHFDGARTWLEWTQDLAEGNWTRPRTVPAGKYGRMLIVPVGSNQGNTVVN